MNYLKLVIKLAINALVFILIKKALLCFNNIFNIENIINIVLVLFLLICFYDYLKTEKENYKEDLLKKIEKNTRKSC